jgi:hypothetical protein
MRSFAATAALLAPLEHSRMIRARNATDRALRGCRVMRSNSAFCPGLTDGYDLCTFAAFRFTDVVLFFLRVRNSRR